MIKYFVPFLIIFLVSACNDSPIAESPSENKVIMENSEVVTSKTTELPNQNDAEFETDSLTISITQSDLGYGYIISANDKPIIIQEHIPGIQGLAGFKDEKSSKAVAELMVYKLNNNIMPPSVTIAELDSLNIEYEK